MQVVDRPKQPTIASGREKVWNIAALVLAIIWIVAISFTLSTDIDDFKEYWSAAANFRATANPYAQAPYPHLYVYPPLLAYLVQPLTVFSLQTAQYIWYVLNCVSLGLFLWICITTSNSILARRYWGVVVLATCLAPPTRLSLQLGQISIMLALLIVAGYAVASRTPALTGFLLGLASMIKLYPAFISLYYLLRQAKTVLTWTIITPIVIFLATLLLHGMMPFQQYLRNALILGTHTASGQHNISLFGFWGRLLTASRYAIPVIKSPTLANIMIGVTGGVVVYACIRGWINSDNSFTHLLLFSMYVCAMMLLSPSNGYYNLVLLLLPLLTLLHYLELQPHHALRNWLVLGTALIWIPPNWSDHNPFLYQLVRIRWGVLLFTPSFFGLLIFMTLHLWLLQRQSKGHIISTQENVR